MRRIYVGKASVMFGGVGGVKLSGGRKGDFGRTTRIVMHKSIRECPTTEVRSAMELVDVDWNDEAFDI